MKERLRAHQVEAHVKKKEDWELRRFFNTTLPSKTIWLLWELGHILKFSHKGDLIADLVDREAKRMRVKLPRVPKTKT